MPLFPFYTRRALSYRTKDLMVLARGKRPWGLWRRNVADLFRRLRCRIRGHAIVKNAYMNSETREIAEYHCGCLSCPLFWTEKVSAETKARRGVVHTQGLVARLRGRGR